MGKFTGDQYHRDLRMKSPIVSAVFVEACIQDSAGKYFQDFGIQNTYYVLAKESCKYPSLLLSFFFQQKKAVAKEIIVFTKLFYSIFE